MDGSIDPAVPSRPLGPATGNPVARDGGPGMSRAAVFRSPETAMLRANDELTATSPAPAGDARHHQALSGRGRQRRHRPRRPAGRDPRPARRERRRQVDADERPLRPGPARRGPDPARRRAGQDHRPERRHRARHQHGPPALHARAGAVGGRQHPARRRDHGQPDLPRPQGSQSAHPGAGRPVRLRDRSRRQDRVALGRLAAARRDPQGALPRGADPGARRADGGAHAAGDQGSLRRAAPPRRRGSQHHLHQPQAVRGARDRRPDHGHPARQGRRLARYPTRPARRTSPS